MSYDLIVTGIHLHKNFGYTKKEIIDEKFKIFAEFKIFDKDYFEKNDGAKMSEAVGKAFINLPNIIERSKPDIILSGFDIAANLHYQYVAPMNIPVLIFKVGVSGTIDESLRHAMSKFSNFHLQLQKDKKKIN